MPLIVNLLQLNGFKTSIYSFICLCLGMTHVFASSRLRLCAQTKPVTFSMRLVQFFKWLKTMTSLKLFYRGFQVMDCCTTPSYKVLHKAYIYKNNSHHLVKQVA